MNDLNFFEPYVDKKELKIERDFIYLFVVIIIVIIMLSSSVSNYIKTKKLNIQVVEKKTMLESNKYKTKIKEIDENGKQLDILKDETSKLNKIDDFIKDEEFIDEYLIDTIISKVPRNIFFKNMDISEETLQINGVSKEKWSIADFQKNLSSIDGFNDIFISDISFDGGYYNFTLIIRFKDVNDDGIEEQNQTQDETENDTDETDEEDQVNQ